MKKTTKNIIILVIFFTVTSIYSQVGIGTTNPHSSSILEINSENKGVLISRVALTSLNDIITIPSPATGLLVYNTATSGTSPNNVAPGYYYYDSAKWVALAYFNGTNINIQTSNYTLSVNDTKGVLIMNSATPVTVTVPTILPKGFFCQIIQKGAGQVTVVGDTGFVLNSANGFKTRTLNSSIGVVLETNALGYISGDSTF